MPVKIKTTCRPENQPPYEEWVRIYKFSSQYYESYNNGISFGDAIEYAREQMRNSVGTANRVNNDWPKKNS